MLCTQTGKLNDASPHSHSLCHVTPPKTNTNDHTDHSKPKRVHRLGRVCFYSWFYVITNSLLNLYYLGFVINDTTDPTLASSFKSESVGRFYIRQNNDNDAAQRRGTTTTTCHVNDEAWRRQRATSTTRHNDVSVPHRRQGTMTTGHNAMGLGHDMTGHNDELTGSRRVGLWMGLETQTCLEPLVCFLSFFFIYFTNFY